MPSLRTHGFFPHWFLREAVEEYDLKPSHISVFFAICDQLDSHGYARISQRLIQSRTRLARSTVQTVLEDLLELRLVEKTWPAGVKSAAQYRVPDEAPIAPMKIPAPTVVDEALRTRRRA